MDKYSEKLNHLFSQFEEIKLVYLFGSQATKRVTPLSDYDFAVYLDEKTSSDRKSDIVLNLNFQISSILKTNNVDIVLLNNQPSPLLKFNIINDGKLFYEKAPYKIMVEPIIYNEYFDFKVFSQTHNL